MNEREEAANLDGCEQLVCEQGRKKEKNLFFFDLLFFPFSSLARLSPGERLRASRAHSLSLSALGALLARSLLQGRRRASRRSRLSLFLSSPSCCCCCCCRCCCCCLLPLLALLAPLALFSLISGAADCEHPAPPAPNRGGGKRGRGNAKIDAARAPLLPSGLFFFFPLGRSLLLRSSLSLSLTLLSLSQSKRSALSAFSLSLSLSLLLLFDSLCLLTSERSLARHAAQLERACRLRTTGGGDNLD